ncbi:methyltransferase domain-containing protein [Asanoa sp. NPDC050611]|uniref:class I SAM-dependent methyltransferase n=1 Tax=Asanoa sp. NPDC050611 TaxID=3157098 RepID=UPI0033CE19DA
MVLDELADRTVLTTREYATPDRLNARIALYAYQEPRHDLVGSAVRLLHRAPGPVLDVGCGPGHYRAALRVDRPDRAAIACDLSMGMLLVAGSPALVADAAALPVRDASCGAVLAMHMLYHVPDPEAGVAELARVRAPDGTVLLSTNGARDKRRPRDLHDEVVRELTGGPARRHLTRRFNLEDGERMARRHFRTVERIDFVSTIAVPDPEPVVRWLGSMGDAAPALLGEVRARITAIIEREGTFRLDAHAGFLLCR